MSDSGKKIDFETGPESGKERPAVYMLNAADAGDFARIVERVGSDPGALPYLQPKRRILHLFAPGVDYRAAGFIKQELLSRGGDAVVAKHVIDGRTERSDILMMGTDSQIFRLLQKMKAMDIWGLKDLRESLARAVQNAAVSRWVLPLPGGRTLDLGGGTKIMGILNVTPDSFHPESRASGEEDLLLRAEAMLEAGADVLDVGAESTRPGASPIPESVEQSRLLPAVRALRRAFPEAVISADTYRGGTALAAAEAGADIINDVGGFGLDEAMPGCAARSGLPYVLSHIRGNPSIMGSLPPCDDLLTGMHLYFQQKLAVAEEAGLPRERILIDPGLGFGKDAEENLVILKEMESFRSLGRPLLIGHSRKGFIGSAAGGQTPQERLHGTVAVSALLEGRVELLRVHDVGPNRQALLIARAIREARPWRG